MLSLTDELYSQIVDKTSSVIFIIDPEGKILFLNNFAKTLFGYSEEELLGQKILGTIIPEVESTGRELTSLINDLTLNPERYIYSTNECLRKNGDFIWIAWSNAPIYDEEGKLSKIISVGNDITSRKVAEESYKKLMKMAQEEMVTCSDETEAIKNQLRTEMVERKLAEKKLCELEEHLQHTEKMQAIGQLAGGIANDFNNQLACIIGYADILLNRCKNDETTHYLDLITKAANRSAKLTAQLLNFSQKGKNQPCLVNVHRIITDVISLLSQSLDENIEIRQFLSAKPPITMGDPIQLQNALLNITINAIDAMQDGGQIIFTSENVSFDEEFVKNSPHQIEAGPYLKIAVIDTGSGISEHIQAKIFDPFFTTKEVGEGNGMGLSVVNDIVKAHKGFINISSALEKGTTAVIYLPLSKNPSAIFQKSSKKTPKANQQACVMLVDDDEDSRSMASEMLLELGYEVKTCEDGIAAMKYYNKSWQKIDIVIIDMIMPKMSGFDTFLAMREINPSIKAIIACGHSLGNNAREILQEGVFSYVQKPFKMAQLAHQVATCLESNPEMLQFATVS